jgi:hypothetical protein
LCGEGAWPASSSAGQECGGDGALAAPFRRFQHTLERPILTMLESNVFYTVLLMGCDN